MGVVIYYYAVVGDIGFHVALIIDVPKIRNSYDTFTIALPYNGIKRLIRSRSYNDVMMMRPNLMHIRNRSIHV